jgi:hypothetical protein
MKEGDKRRDQPERLCRVSDQPDLSCERRRRIIVPNYEDAPQNMHQQPKIIYQQYRIYLS